MNREILEEIRRSELEAAWKRLRSPGGIIFMVVSALVIALLTITLIDVSK